MAKYKLRFFFEYGSGCLWSANDESRELFGYPVSLEKLPISKELREHLLQLEDEFQTSLNWDSPPDPSPWRQDTCDTFNTEVVKVFNKLIEELGLEFEVVNEQEMATEDPDLDEYIKNPKEFRRNE